MGKVVVIILTVVLLVSILPAHQNLNQEVKFGITFSTRYAKYLKLDWQKTYLKILDDLQVKNLRLMTYWDDIQAQQNKDNFAETDFFLEEAQKRGAKVILVVGEKQPRWPECYIPTWAKDLSPNDRQQKLLEFVQKVVSRYKDNSAITAWQVENEPFLQFGEGCDNSGQNFLSEEVSLVKSISHKPIIVTDSGELGFWVAPMQASEVFGTTIYRKVYDHTLGYVTYPLPPAFYSLKSTLIRKIFAPANQKTIIVELQAEPWLSEGELRPADEQVQYFTLADFKNYTDFAKQTGFDEVYLWGVEWWYFMAKQGYPEYLNFAKTLFK